MSRVIYKYDLSMADQMDIKMPTGAEFLSIQLQGLSNFKLWVAVDPLREPEIRTIIMRGTGHPLPNKAIKHISTVQQEMYVWHFFEVLKPLVNENPE